MKPQRDFNVVCIACGRVWTPRVKSTLWGKAKKRADKYFDALHVSSQECGCEAVLHPEAPYRVVGYDDMCRDFDIPFFSFVEAVKQYLLLARDGMYVVSFVNKRMEDKNMRSKVIMRLAELKYSR